MKIKLNIFLIFLAFAGSALFGDCEPPCDENDPNDPCDCDVMPAEVF